MKYNIVEKLFNSETGQIQYKPLGFVWDSVTGTTAPTNNEFDPEAVIDESLFCIVAGGVPNYGTTSDVVDISGESVAVTVGELSANVTTPTAQNIQDKINQLLIEQNFGGIATSLTVAADTIRVNVVLKTRVAITIGIRTIIYF